jgi:hypothetical protein
MALGREDVAVAGTDGGPHVLRLAGFLRDDDLISHSGSLGRIGQPREHMANKVTLQAIPAPFKVTQPTNLGVGSSNLSGRAHFPFEINYSRGPFHGR